MQRSAFVSGLSAAMFAARASAFAELARPGIITTQNALFSSLPRPAVRDWTRVILGSGAVYQKQIGAGEEIASDGSTLLYYELQVGSPGGSCNPSTMRKAYLKAPAFGSLFDTYPLISNIGRTENMVYRYGDVKGDGLHQQPGDTTLRLLDEDYLYETRPLRIVSVSQRRIHVSSTNLTATHVAGEFVGKPGAHQRLRRIELWHHPAFPFGVARYEAAVAGLDPFKLHVFSHGRDFETLLSMPLGKVRAITRNGAYGQIPISVGA